MKASSATKYNADRSTEPMVYESCTLQRELTITDLYSIHYFEYTTDFVYYGEYHDFWELVFVDNGCIEVTAGDEVMILQKGEILFHEPNEFHALRADGSSTPNLIVVSFSCDDPCMDFFRKRRLTLNGTEQFYLSQIITEGRNSFTTRQNNPYVCRLLRRDDASFGSEQMIQLSLEFLLLSIYRRFAEGDAEKGRNRHPLTRSEHLLDHVVEYLNRNVYNHLAVAQICKENMVGRSQLQNLFHKEKGCGVIEYFCRLKIEAAKKLIREKIYTYAEIANMLGYSSYQYFSLQFKKYVRMSPSEYQSSVQNFFNEESRDSPVSEEEKRNCRKTDAASDASEDPG